MKILLLVVLVALFAACREDVTQHEGFMGESDCLVYTDDVVTETLNNYTVDFIDTVKASGCVKTQLSNSFLLNISKSYYLRVYPEHPKNNIQLIKRLIKNFNNNDSRLSSFSRFGNRIMLTLDKKFINPLDKTFHNSFMEWKFVYVTMNGNQWKIDSSEITSLWPWAE